MKQNEISVTDSRPAERGWANRLIQTRICEIREMHERENLRRDGGVRKRSVGLLRRCVQ